MQVILIRHSQTPGNVEFRYNGRTDEPLSEEGVALAEQAGADPGLKTVYVTPLRRTRQTAAILFPNAEQVVVDDLREMNFGDFEGFNYYELKEDTAFCAWLDSGRMAPCPNGESRPEFSDRVCAAFETVVRDGLQRGEQSLTFVIHGGTIMSLMQRFTPSEEDYYFYHTKNCRGYRCDVLWDEKGDTFTFGNQTEWEGNS